MKPSDIVQPYEFGHDASKATCITFVDEHGRRLDLRLPRIAGARVLGRLVPRDRAMGKSDRANNSKGEPFIERWANQTDTGQNRLSPGADRWKARSETFDGIADGIVSVIAPRILDV